MNNICFVVSGPSGSGKNTLIDYLLEENKDLVHSVSATSRSPRPWEKDGVHYYFKDRAEFERMRDNGELLEWDEFRGNYYGTVVADVEKKLGEGKNVAFDITVPGAKNVRRVFGERATTVFLIPPSIKTLRKRLIDRKGDDEDTINKRIEFAMATELMQFDNFMYVIVNDDLTDTKKKISVIYNASLLRGIPENELTEDEAAIISAADKFRVENCKDDVLKIINELRNEDD